MGKSKSKIKMQELKAKLYDLSVKNEFLENQVKIASVTSMINTSDDEYKENLIQSHLKGQQDAGCREPSTSDAVSYVNRLCNEKKSLFTNTLKESFFKGDMISWVNTCTLSVISTCIDGMGSFEYKAGERTTEIMTKASAEKWVKDHEKKEPKFKIGDIIDDQGLSGTGPKRIIHQGQLEEANLKEDSYRVNYVYAVRLIEEMEKLEGAIWNQEKGRYLNLEEVFFKAETKQDLKDIIVASHIELLNSGFDMDISQPYIYLEYQRITNEILDESYLNGKEKVSKETFIKMIENYGKEVL